MFLKQVLNVNVSGKVKNEEWLKYEVTCFSAIQLA